MSQELTPEALALVLALLWDLVLGEPPVRIHPVVWIGRATAAAARRAPRGRPASELAYGAAMALAIPLSSALAGYAILAALDTARVVRLACTVFLLKSTFALGGLGAAASTVRRAVAGEDVPTARGALRSLCSRDASALDQEQILAGAVESVAENTSDSIVAPLLAYLVLGLPGALFYRAANTLDAMIGYHGRFEYLGKPAARLDDLLNFVPARVTAALLLVAGFVLGKDVRSGAQILARDGALTESPNAGRPMAAMAGLLGVVLEKPGHYRLGDPRDAITVRTLDDAWRLSLAASLSLIGLVLAGLGLRHALAG